MIHPVIRVICFVLFAILVSKATALQLAVAFVILASGYLLIIPHQWRYPFRMIWRLKWLMLSIVCIYLLFVPAAELHGKWASGLQALHQVVVLLLLVSAAGLLFITTGRQRLVYAIYWLSRPLSRVSVSPERIAVRLVMTMERVKNLEQLIMAQHASGAENKTHISRMAARLKTVFEQVIEHAENEPLQTVQIPRLENPAVVQWLWPLLLLSIFILLSEPFLITVFP